MKPANTVAKLFSSVSTLAVVASIFVTGVAWGYNGQGQCTIPDSANSGVSAIACGGYFSIALKGGAGPAPTIASI